MSFNRSLLASSSGTAQWVHAPPLALAPQNGRTNSRLASLISAEPCGMRNLAPPLFMKITFTSCPAGSSMPATIPRRR
eukprot:CAMPEP_0182592728 /NCGR_PEP_ID=MMETSP1324-20130603/76515_1 /TAXON_ID=236786 /ORGANISM="Florenciella sp., Strain RCC1587" /LENGTH=77 /DNA_ID=CAMNT_0024810141 /DNA_START=322 /DNA_END=555 /DNA_ORIENTATION=+